MEIHFGESKSEKEDVKIIDQLLRENDRLLGIIENLTFKRDRIRLIVFFHNKNTNMSTVNSVTLTSLTPDQGVIAVVDTANGNEILTGTLANLSAVESDPTQDTASIDPTVANTLDLTAITNTGSTMVTVKGDFTSIGNAGITDGTVFPGITVQVAVTNNIPVTPPPPATPVPGLQVTFP
jgi:hypothetical protein